MVAVVAAISAAPALAQPTEAIIAAGRQIGAYLVPSTAARIAAMPKHLPRAPAPPLGASVRAAQAAVAACAIRKVPVSVLIADFTGAPVVLLSGDGAGLRSQLIAQTKANIVIRYGKSSGEVAKEAETNPALTAEAAADPGIGVLRSGGLPILRDGVVIGAIAVSGAGLTGDFTLDTKCAQAGLALLLG